MLEDLLEQLLAERDRIDRAIAAVREALSDEGKAPGPRPPGKTPSWVFRASTARRGRPPGSKNKPKSGATAKN